MNLRGKKENVPLVALKNKKIALKPKKRKELDEENNVNFNENKPPVKKARHRDNFIGNNKEVANGLFNGSSRGNKEQQLAGRTILGELQQSPTNFSPVLHSGSDTTLIAGPPPKKFPAKKKRKLDSGKPSKKRKNNFIEKATKASYVPSDNFGFNSDDSDIQESCDVSLTKFDSAKPFRLALYVHPSNRVRINPTIIEKFQAINPSFNATNLSTISLKPNSSVMSACGVSAYTLVSPVRQPFKVPMSSTPLDNKKVKLVQRKITDVLLPITKRTRSNNGAKKFASFFDASDSSETENDTCLDVHKSTKTKITSTKSVSSTSNEESTDEELFAKPHRRRSYVKKQRRVEEVQDEPSSDEIMQTMEKTKKKGKAKKKDLQEAEFEKWSRSINSEFDEVDKFEVSFS